MNKMIIKKVIVCLCMLFLANMSYAEDYVFKSYHIYTTDEDKYVKANEQNDSAKLCIDEEKQEIKFSLYNSEAANWMTFDLKISYKADIGYKAKFGTLYMCTNNANKPCGVCICNTKDGAFIDLHDFFEGPQTLSCWVKANK